MEEMQHPIGARALQETFLGSGPPRGTGQLLRFTGTEGLDVYNPSVPFLLEGRTVIAGRVEQRNSENAVTRLFALQPDGSYALMPNAPSFPGMQDPFVTQIGEDVVLGGVHALWRPDGSLITYHTDFYRLHGLNAPEFLFEGPPCMKDVRLLDMKDGRVAVFSRPQGGAVAAQGRRAAIGMAIVPGLAAIRADTVANAPLLSWHFLPDEWGGPNQAHLLPNGLIGLIGHISWGEPVGDTLFLHYYGFVQGIDPVTRKTTPLRVIACRSCFPDAPPKQPRLRDVCFTAGITDRRDGWATLYAGLSDAACGCLRIPDPLAELEAMPGVGE